MRKHFNTKRWLSRGKFAPLLSELLKFANRNVSIRQKGSGELEKSNCTFFSSFNLGWSHYLVLMRMENINERNFYEIGVHQKVWGNHYYFQRVV